MDWSEVGIHFHGRVFMVEAALSQLATVFSRFTDPRKARGIRHPFSSIVALVFLGLLAGITEMAVLVRWARVYWKELQEPLGFTRNQPPCDTTISRALAKLSLDELRLAFSAWLKSVLADREGPWIAAIDGKTCCQGLAADGTPVHMLNVFLQQAKLALDQWSVKGDKTNEPGSFQRHLNELLTAYPTLRVFTGDAIFAQRPLLEMLKANNCDYLFQVKANQPDVLDALKTCFAAASSARPAHETTEKRGSSTIPAEYGSTWTTRSISASV